MIEVKDYKLGSIVKLQKSHPSGTVEWEVIRVGVDIKIKSTIKDGLIIMMERPKFHRAVANVIKY